MKRNTALLLSALVAGALATGCETGGGTGTGGASASSGDGTSAASTSSDATGSTSDASSGASGGSSSSGGPIKDCAEIGATDCFSSYDCPDVDTRCENEGTVDLPVACCVPGPRGPGLAGDACAGENDCKSSLCVEIASGNVCTDVCASSAECPNPPFGGCGPIAFSGSDDEFCLP
ncbi:MAG: hypothetical protein U0414_42570 [Polyangiaceae bacterium]